MRRSRPTHSDSSLRHSSKKDSAAALHKKISTSCSGGSLVTTAYASTDRDGRAGDGWLSLADALLLCELLATKDVARYERAVLRLARAVHERTAATTCRSCARCVSAGGAAAREAQPRHGNLEAHARSMTSGELQSRRFREARLLRVLVLKTCAHSDKVDWPGLAMTTAEGA